MILDHVRFTPTFLPNEKGTWVLAAVNEDDNGYSVHKLLASEVRQVLALPEVLKKFFTADSTVVQQMARRITELQTIVDKRDDRQWDPIVEMFHPDMNVSDIALAIKNLLALFGACAYNSATVAIAQHLLACRAALWEDRATQLEKDEAQESPPPNPEDIALTDALERGARRAAAAEALWQLLDDIDTLSDKIKPDSLRRYSRFYSDALDIAKKRHEYLKSDGHKLTWPIANDGNAPTKHKDLAEAVECAVGGYAWKCAFPEHEWIVRGVSELFDRAHTATAPPVPMLLHCPMCHTRHIDEGEFATKSHTTHSCQGHVVIDGKRRRCGHTWRPAVVPTVGVESLPGFFNEPEPASMVRVGHRVRLDNGYTGRIMSYDADAQLYRVAGGGSSIRCKREEFTVIEKLK